MPHRATSDTQDYGPDPGSGKRVLGGGASCELLPDHAQKIAESAISDEVRDARGYFTAQTKSELDRLGFTPSQQLPPALIHPLHSVYGEVPFVQARPDHPRNGRDGRPIKYETPRGAHNHLDVHPFMRQYLGDPDRPLWWTEGIRKADAATTRELCTIALLGVSSWRGTNTDGGQTLLADLEAVHLRGRTNYIAFDSDVMTKPTVYAELVRFWRLLASRGADVLAVYLPPAPGGGKNGLDDFFAGGATVADLMELATPELREPGRPEVHEGNRWEVGPYTMTVNGITWERPTKDGTVPTTLSNFAARIVRDVVRDDGQEQSFEHEVEVQIGDARYSGRVQSTGFMSLDWVTRVAGSRAILSPGMGLRDHCRAAIQHLSGDIPRHTIYAHTGWRQIDGQQLYLHAGGAVGPQGPVPGIEVELGPQLEPFRLPDPPEDPREAVEASLGLLTAARLRLSLPVLLAPYRAAIGEPKCTVNLYGHTGRRKTTLGELGQQHFGAGFGGHPPASWESTANALEAIAFTAKDATLLVDDYNHDGTTLDRQRKQQAAGRLIRGAANSGGRDRLRADARLRPAMRPRCLPLSTAEEPFEGASLNARIVNLEVEEDDIPITPDLDRAQAHARSGTYAEAMAAFVRWLAPQLDEVRHRIAQRTAELRPSIQAGHDRVSSTLAELVATLEVLLDFADSVGAWSPVTLEQGTEQILALAAEQAQRQQDLDPVTRFLELLGSCIASGEAHVASRSGGAPPQPECWGWRRRAAASWGGEAEWVPMGRRVGWVEGDDLYLEPPTAYATVLALANRTEQPLGMSQKTLYKRFMERRLLRSHDAGRPTTRERNLEGAQKRVLHVGTPLFQNRSHRSQRSGEPDPEFGLGPETGTGSRPGAQELVPETGPKQAGFEFNGSHPGPPGPVGPEENTPHDPEEETSSWGVDEELVVVDDRPNEWLNEEESATAEMLRRNDEVEST